MTKNSIAISDAAESNAGDNYHILWAVRKSLELLNFSKDGLKALTVEGLMKEDEKSLDPQSLLGVDLTEYYGGLNFKAAKQVVVSQIKYSTRHVNKSWTAAIICQGKKKGSDGSIIHRLGVFFSKFLTNNSTREIQKKLTLKLVSNRPVDPKLLALINKVQKNLKVNKSLTSYVLLKQTLISSDITTLDRLFKASLLADDTFITFLQILDFSDCAAGSSFEQKLKSLAAIANLGAIENDVQLSQLRELVWEKMLHTGKDNHQLVIENILYLFKFNDLSDLLPVPNLITLPKNLILREQIGPITTLIDTTTVPLLCLHGGAGMGKSTIVSMIPDQLPKGSKTIIFDCYGGGAYAYPDDKRHKPENAYLQLCNQMAIEIGSPFLLTRSKDGDFYIKEFKKRITHAVTILRKLNPQALLLFIIDAADNSISAAKNTHSESFVTELVGIVIPDGCKVVISSRTERKHLLNLPDHYEDILIQPFSEKETAAFLKPYYPAVTDQQVDDFKKLTNGVPRVMSYAIALPGVNLDQKTAPLRPTGKTLEEIFRLQIDEAEKRAGNSGLIKRFLTSLITLPTPVPLSYVQKLSGLSDEAISDLGTDLWRGLILKDGTFSIRDEDFETYLRRTYTINKDEFVKIATLLEEDADKNEYASLHLGTYLSHAGLKDKLIEIVLERQYLRFPADPVKNKEVFIDRARLAMRQTNANDLNFLKLQMVAADAAKTNTILEDILLNKADLAAAYGNLQTNQKIYFQSGNPAWFGPVHFRNAAVYSRNKLTHELAREHLRKAETWVNYRATLSDEKAEGYDLKAIDAAAGAEAVFRLAGAENCVRWLESWYPNTFIYGIVSHLIHSFIIYEDVAPINKWLSKNKVRIDIKLMIVELMSSNGLTPNIEISKTITEMRPLLRLKGKLNVAVMGSILAFVEFALRHGQAFEDVVELLDLVSTKDFNYFPGFYRSHQSDNDMVNMDFTFRKAALFKLYMGASYTVSDFYPDHVKKWVEKSEKGNRHDAPEDKKKFDDVFKHFIPAYEVRANYLLKKTTEKKAMADIKKILYDLDRNWEISYRYEFQSSGINYYLCKRLLDIVFYCKKEEILDSIANGFTTKKNHNIDLLLYIAERISKRKIYFPYSLKLLDRVDKIVDTEMLPGNEIIDAYSRCTTVASRISKLDGKYYFDKMVLASNEIDLEAFDQLRCIDTIIEDEKGYGDPQLAFSLARYTEYCSERLAGYDHFPWDEAFRSIARCDIASLWTISCRWDHRNTRHLNKHFTELLEESLQQNFIDHITAGAFLPINQYYWTGLNKLLKLILDKYDIVGSHIDKMLFIADFIHDLKIHHVPRISEEFLSDFLPLIKDGKFIDKALIDDLQHFYDKTHFFKYGSPRKPKKEKSYKQSKYTDKRVIDYLKSVHIEDGFSIEKIITDLRKDAPRHFVNERYILDLLKEKVKHGQEVIFLDAIARIPEDYISFSAFEHAIEDYLAAWNHYPQIQTWKKSIFPAVIKNWFYLLTSHGSADNYSLKRLATIFDISEAEYAQQLTSLLPEYIDDLSAEVLYQLFKITAIGLSSEDKKKLISWSLSRWGEKIKPDFSEGSDPKNFLPPSSADECVHGLIRYYMGHPYKSLRWRMAHSLRRFVKYGHTTIINRLLETVNQRTNSVFQDVKLPYYWISAKLYFAIALERASRECPGNLTFLAGKLHDEIQNAELPHVQIIYFLRSCCLQLKKHQPDLFNNEQLHLIEHCLDSTKGRKKKTYPKVGRGEKRSDKLRFEFDSLDTLPYWYHSLGSVFDVSEYVVAAIADKYITEKWGFTGDPRKDNHVKSDEYYDTSNRQGSEPSVEDLRTYYEYHAMFCAASELRVSHAEVSDHYENWHDWLKGWGNCWDQYWLADLRDPVPLEERYWNNDRELQDWEWNIHKSNFDEALCLNKDNDCLVVSERSANYYGKDHEDLKITTGLVAIETGPALARALQATSSLDNYLPFGKGDFDDEHHQIGDARFTVFDWITTIKTERDGIDDRDVLFHDIEKYRLKSSSSFMKFGGFQRSEDYRYTFKNDNPIDWVTQFQVWNTTEKQLHYGEFYTSGERLIIKKTTLLSFLLHMNKCLIINSQIRRRPDRREYSEYYPSYCFIYLIYPNGKVETLYGNHSIR